MDAGQNPLHTVRRAILVVDLVESVRLMQQFEADVISRWRRFITEAQQLLPQHGGRLVRSLGDGMLIEFASAPRAAEVAGALHLRIARYNEGHSLESALHLRAGAHVADVVSDEIDVFGAGVNLASRLCSLASPGETVVSTDFRDGLVAGLDPDVEDLGECQLKNIAGTVRAFRIGRSSQPVVLPGFDTFATERPAFAALPLQCDPSDHDAEVVGEVVLDQLIHELSLCGAWRVISRLSMVSFRGRQPDLAELDKILKPTWVVSGRCRVIGTGVRLSLEVADVRSASVLWSEVLEIRT